MDFTGFTNANWVGDRKSKQSTFKYVCFSLEDVPLHGVQSNNQM